MSRVFDNNFVLPRRIIQKRLSAIDSDVEFVAYSVSVQNDLGQILGIHYYISINSMSTDAQIQSALGFSVTVEEQNYLNDLTIDKQAIANAYQNMITRLEQIQNAGTIPFTQAGFNQVVQAIKDDSLYIERVMKALRDIVT